MHFKRPILGGVDHLTYSGVDCYKHLFFFTLFHELKVLFFSGRDGMMARAKITWLTYRIQSHV